MQLCVIFYGGVVYLRNVIRCIDLLFFTFHWCQPCMHNANMTCAFSFHTYIFSDIFLQVPFPKLTLDIYVEELICGMDLSFVMIVTLWHIYAFRCAMWPRPSQYACTLKNFIQICICQCNWSEISCVYSFLFLPMVFPFEVFSTSRKQLRFH